MKGQVSVESVMLVGVSTLLLIPVTYLFYTFLQGSSVEIVENSVDRIGKSFVQNTNRMYFLGKHAKIVVDYTFPEEIINMTTDDNKSVSFQIETNRGVYWMSYAFETEIRANFTERDWSAGDKRYEFKTMAGGDVVSIRRI